MALMARKRRERCWLLLLFLFLKDKVLWQIKLGKDWSLERVEASHSLEAVLNNHENQLIRDVQLNHSVTS
jgi:hypothetical protein